MGQDCGCSRVGSQGGVRGVLVWSIGFLGVGWPGFGGRATSSIHIRPHVVKKCHRDHSHVVIKGGWQNLGKELKKIRERERDIKRKRERDRERERYRDQQRERERERDGQELAGLHLLSPSEMQSRKFVRDSHPT